MTETRANVAARLAELGIALPEAAAPAGAYLPYTVAGGLVFLAGQVPMDAGRVVWRGKLGAGLAVEDGRAAARLCALNLLAQLRAACDGDLDRVARCLRLGGFVNCAPDFAHHPAVIDGASELMVQVFGERGRHARFAVGAPALPFDAAVEIEAIFALA